MKKASEKPKETTKRERKKQSISGRRQQRKEEGAGGRKRARALLKSTISQSPRQKAAINPAKRVEVNDKLHFDSVAEWDADKRFKHEETLKL